MIKHIKLIKRNNSLLLIRIFNHFYTETSNTQKKTHKINYVSFPSSPNTTQDRKNPFCHNNEQTDDRKIKGFNH